MGRFGGVPREALRGVGIPPLSSGLLNWQTNDGWVKMAQNVNGVEIHYVKNSITGVVEEIEPADTDESAPGRP